VSSIVYFLRSQSTIVIFLSLLLGSGVFSHLVTGDYVNDSSGKQVALTAKLLLACSYGLSLSLIVLFWQEFKAKMTPAVWVWAGLISWCAISLMFGQFSIPTMIRFAGLLGATLIGFMLFVCTENVKQALKPLFWGMVAIIIINVFYLDGAILLDSETKNIKGVFFQKNQLGQFSFLAMLISGFVFFTQPKAYKFVGSITFVVAAWLLYLSTSTTSNLLVLITLVTIAAIVIMRCYAKGGWGVLAVILLAGSILAFNWNDAFSLIGKNATLTGRTSIWAEYWTLIEQRMWLGHGYGAYPEKITHWLRLSHHNGYISLLYYSGIIGSCIMAVIIGLAIKQGLYIVRNSTLTLEAYFLITFLIVFLTVNISETYMLNRSGLFWPLFIYATLQLALLRKKNRA